MEKEYIVPVGEGLYSVNTGDWRTRRPVMDEDKCIGCGICYLYCPVFCIEPVQGKFKINYDYCKGCGICAHECKKQAIVMALEGGK